jgi:hypothetical protein
MCYGFTVAYIFTRNAGESAGIIFITGTTLTLLQWFFEILWDKHIRTRLRHAISGQQSRIDRLVRWRRGTRTVSLDEHEPRSHGGEAGTNPLSPQNAGREWT